MKPEIKWVKCDVGYNAIEASWDQFWLCCYFDNRLKAIVAYVCGDVENYKFEQRFTCDGRGLEEAKAWCESQLPHLIAMEICDET